VRAWTSRLDVERQLRHCAIVAVVQAADFWQATMSPADGGRIGLVIGASLPTARCVRECRLDACLDHVIVLNATGLSMLLLDAR
jgi:hypothetical protein